MKYLFGYYAPSVIVDPPPPELIITTTSVPTVVENTVYPTTQMTATGGVPPYTWTLVAPNNVLPIGLTLSSDGVLSGTAYQVGEFIIRVRVTDSTGVTATSGFFNLIVDAENIGGPTLLTMVTTSIPSGMRNVVYPSTTFVASGGTPPYTWSRVAPNNVLPSGMAFSSTGVLSGTPTVTGTFSVQFRVTDSTGATADRGLLPLNIADVSSVVIVTSPTLTTATVDAPYSRTLQATGGVPGYTWSKVSGDYPAGITMSAAGVLSGTPTIANMTSVFTVKVVDSEGREATRTFSLTVQVAGAVEGPHDLFNYLITLPEHFQSWSLRSNTSIFSLMSDKVTNSGVWSYDYDNDPYHDKQDAAKLRMGHSLSTPYQLLHTLTPGANVVSGKLAIVTDFWWGSEFYDNISTVTGLNHKFMQIEDNGPNGSGTSIYIEPRALYRPGSLTAPEIAFRDLRTYGQGSNDIGYASLKEWGQVRNTSYEPTGPGTPTSNVVSKYEIWTRHYFEVQLDVPGTAFTDWMAAYSSSPFPLGTRNIVAATPDGLGNTIIEVGEMTNVTKKGAIENLWEDVYATGQVVKCTITVTGHSNPALNATHIVEVVDLTHLLLRGVEISGTGGQASKHYHMFSWWMADENTEPFRVVYKVPIQKRNNGKISEFRHELNTSDKPDVVKGWELTTPPTVGNPTIITTPEPHGMSTDDAIHITGSSVIRIGAYYVTVISPTQFSIPFEVLTEPVSATGIFGRVSKALVGYARNTVFLRNLNIDEGDTNFFRKPKRGI